MYESLKVHCIVSQEVIQLFVHCLLTASVLLTVGIVVVGVTLLLLNRLQIFRWFIQTNNGSSCSLLFDQTCEWIKFIKISLFPMPINFRIIIIKNRHVLTLMHRWLLILNVDIIFNVHYVLLDKYFFVLNLRWFHNKGWLLTSHGILVAKKYLFLELLVRILIFTWVDSCMASLRIKTCGSLKWCFGVKNLFPIISYLISSLFVLLIMATSG